LDLSFPCLRAESGQKIAGQRMAAACPILAPLGFASFDAIIPFDRGACKKRPSSCNKSTFLDPPF
jgi:hypothetical protein